MRVGVRDGDATRRVGADGGHGERADFVRELCGEEGVREGAGRCDC